MSTLMKTAKNGKTTEEMEIVARNEQVDVDFIRRGIEKGRIIIPKSNRRELNPPIGIGKGLLVKINANIGSSKTVCNIDEELEKAKIAVKFGADTVMDLSTGITESNVQTIRKRILDELNVPIGTVPIYQSALRAIETKGAIIHMDEDDMFNVIEEQAKEGVDFFTIHVGVTKEIIDYLVDHPRTMGVVSRGGTFLASWILAALLHNLIYGLFQSYFDARGGDEFIFFIIAVFIIPLYFIVCLVYSIIFWIKKKRIFSSVKNK